MEDNQVLPGLTEVTREICEPDPGSVSERKRPNPRFEPIDREQLVMKVVDVERLVDRDHPVRAIWEFVGRLDLSGFCEHVKAVEGERGRPAYDPQLLVSLWIYAYSRGVSSAREIERQCEYDPACQWLTGMKVVNHHSLSDFRVDHGEAVKKLFAGILGVLTHEGLIGLERMTQDGTKIKASASPRTFREEKTVEQHLETARKHMEEVEAQTEAETNVRASKAQRRAAREKKQRLEAALEEFTKIKGKQSEAKNKEEKKQEEKKEKKKKEVRASEVEPEARIMKHNDGGFGPSYNLQLSIDQLHGIIVGVDTSQAPTDYDELIPGLERVKENTGELPDQVLADGGYVSGENIHKMLEMKVDFIAPITDSFTQSKNSGIDPAFVREAFEYDEASNSYKCPAGKTLSYKGKERRRRTWRYRYRASAADCQPCPFKQQCCPKSGADGRSVMRQDHDSAVVNHRAKMETEEAKEIYKQRGPTAEFPNAWIKEKLGLRRFRVRGLVKARLEATWACATYNIQQWTRLRWMDQWAPGKT
jgi:transposase